MASKRVYADVRDGGVGHSQDVHVTTIKDSYGDDSLNNGPASSDAGVTDVWVAADGDGEDEGARGWRPIRIRANPIET
jgi:hypothetical protein